MLTSLDENPPEGNRAAVTPGGTSARREELGDDRRHRRGRDAGHEEPKNAPDLADSAGWLQRNVNNTVSLKSSDTTIVLKAVITVGTTRYTLNSNDMKYAEL